MFFWKSYQYMLFLEAQCYLLVPNFNTWGTRAFRRRGKEDSAEGNSWCKSGTVKWNRVPAWQTCFIIRFAWNRFCLRTNFIGKELKLQFLGLICKFFPWKDKKRIKKVAKAAVHHFVRQWRSDLALAVSACDMSLDKIEMLQKMKSDKRWICVGGCAETVRMPLDPGFTYEYCHFASSSSTY